MRNWWSWEPIEITIGLNRPIALLAGDANLFPQHDWSPMIVYSRQKLRTRYDETQIPILNDNPRLHHPVCSVGIANQGK